MFFPKPTFVHISHCHMHCMCNCSHSTTFTLHSPNAHIQLHSKRRRTFAYIQKVCIHYTFNKIIHTITDAAMPLTFKCIYIHSLCMGPRVLQHINTLYTTTQKSHFPPLQSTLGQIDRVERSTKRIAYHFSSVSASFRA